MPKVRIKATTKVKKKEKLRPKDEKVGGIFTAKVVAIVKKNNNNKNGKVSR